MYPVLSRFFSLCVCVCVFMVGSLLLSLWISPCFKRFFNLPPYVKKLETIQGHTKTRTRTRQIGKGTNPCFLVSFFPSQSVSLRFLEVSCSKGSIFDYFRCVRSILFGFSFTAPLTGPIFWWIKTLGTLLFSSKSQRFVHAKTKKTPGRAGA